MLARLAGVLTTDDALDLVASFYPDEQVSAKVAFGVQEIMEDIENKKATQKGRGPTP